MATDKQFNELMPMMQAQSASLFHSITRVEVTISPNTDDKEVYAQSGRLALTGLAIAKLATAAGIRSVPNENYPTDDGKHPHYRSWHWAGQWTQPDGMELQLAGDYTLDLRETVEVDGQKIYGPRFEKALYDNRLKLSFSQAKTEKMNEAIRYLDNLVGEAKDTLEAKSLDMTRREMAARRIHITSLAQTGAMDRAVRKLLQLKATYTAQELQRPFVVYRSRFDFDLMAERLGPEQTRILAIAAASKTLGVDVDTLRQIAAPPTNGGESPDTSIPLPWREGKAEAADHLDAKLDIALVERAKAVIKPSAHLRNHLKKHYQAAKWGDLTYEQAVGLWQHLEMIDGEV